MEIEVRRNTLLMAAIGAVLAILGGLGYFATPHNQDGRPVLLLPDVRAVEQYRRSASEWAIALRVLDGDLRQIQTVGGTDYDLLATSQETQQAFRQVIAIARDVDRVQPPASLIGLHDQVMATALAYLDAGIALSRWVSAPSEENRLAAEQALVRANEKLAVLEANEWLRLNREA